MLKRFLHLLENYDDKGDLVAYPFMFFVLSSFVMIGIYGVLRHAGLTMPNWLFPLGTITGQISALIVSYKKLVSRELREIELLTSQYMTQSQPFIAECVFCIQRYIADGELTGNALMLGEAKRLLVSMPIINRERKSILSAMKYTSSDIKKVMYKRSLAEIDARIKRITELYSKEHVRLLAEGRDIGASNAEKVLDNFSGIHTLESVLEKIEPLSEAGDEVDGLTFGGADSLSREIDSLVKPKVINLMT
jgi:hypothetical protein